MLFVRMVISLACMLDFDMATADIKGAYMQSGPVMREVYIRPPKDCHRKRGIVWKLLKLPYSMAEAGRQWQLRVDDLRLGKAGMTRADGGNQLFMKRKGKMIILIVAKVIDDFFIAGKLRTLRNSWQTYHPNSSSGTRQLVETSDSMGARYKQAKGQSKSPCGTTLRGWCRSSCRGPEESKGRSRLHHRKNRTIAV